MDYLERNDFKRLEQIGNRLIRARDGTRPVLVLVTNRDYVPWTLVHRANETGARIDMLSVVVEADGSGRIRHQMNVG